MKISIFATAAALSLLLSVSTLPATTQQSQKDIDQQKPSVKSKSPNSVGKPTTKTLVGTNKARTAASGNPNDVSRSTKKIKPADSQKKPKPKTEVSTPKKKSSSPKARSPDSSTGAAKAKDKKTTTTKKPKTDGKSSTSAKSSPAGSTLKASLQSGRQAPAPGSQIPPGEYDPNRPIVAVLDDLSATVKGLSDSTRHAERVTTWESGEKDTIENWINDASRRTGIVKDRTSKINNARNNAATSFLQTAVIQENDASKAAELLDPKGTVKSNNATLEAVATDLDAAATSITGAWGQFV